MPPRQSFLFLNSSVFVIYKISLTIFTGSGWFVLYLSLTFYCYWWLNLLSSRFDINISPRLEMLTVNWSINFLWLIHSIIFLSHVMVVDRIISYSRVIRFYDTQFDSLEFTILILDSVRFFFTAHTFFFSHHHAQFMKTQFWFNAWIYNAYSRLNALFFPRLMKFFPPSSRTIHETSILVSTLEFTNFFFILDSMHFFFTSHVVFPTLIAHNSRILDSDIEARIYNAHSRRDALFHHGSWNFHHHRTQFAKPWFWYQHSLLRWSIFHSSVTYSLSFYATILRLLNLLKFHLDHRMTLWFSSYACVNMI